jgi:hypothetical protein
VRRGGVAAQCRAVLAAHAWRAPGGGKGAALPHTLLAVALDQTALAGAALAHRQHLDAEKVAHAGFHRPSLDLSRLRRRRRVSQPGSAVSR